MRQPAAACCQPSMLPDAAPLGFNVQCRSPSRAAGIDFCAEIGRRAAFMFTFAFT